MSDYDAAANGAACYALAIATMRDKLESLHKVQIGACTLCRADCNDVLPLLPRVDAVVVDAFDAVVYNLKNEKPTSRKPKTSGRSEVALGATAEVHSGQVRDGGLVPAEAGGSLRSDTARNPAGFDASEYRLEVEGASGRSERQVQGRVAEHAIPGNGAKNALQSLRRDSLAGGSSHRRGSHEQHAEELGSSLLALPQQPPQTGMVELPKGWAIITDPPASTETQTSFLEGA